MNKTFIYSYLTLNITTKNTYTIINNYYVI